MSRSMVAFTTIATLLLAGGCGARTEVLDPEHEAPAPSGSAAPEGGAAAPGVASEGDADDSSSAGDGAAGSGGQDGTPVTGHAQDEPTSREPDRSPNLTASADPLVPLTQTRPRFLAVASGASHTCALDRDHEALCWGSNERGELDAAPGPFVELAAGDGFSCGLRSDGSVACWGDAPAGLVDATDIAELDASGNGACAIRDSDRSLTCYRRGGSNEALPRGRFQEVAAGSWNSGCAIDDSRTVHCWGSWTDTDRGRDRVLDDPRGFVSVDVSRHACGLKRDRTMRCWGPVSHTGEVWELPGEFRAVTLGAIHACAIQQDGSIRCWGYNTPPEPGQPVRSMDQTRAPKGKFVAISAGEYHTCAIRKDSTMVCFGWNDHGQSRPP